MDDTFTHVLLNGYGLKLISAVKSRSGFICKTDKGLKELRKSYGDINKILFERDIRQYLIENGFFNVHPLITGLDGNPYYTFDEVDYILEEYIPSEEADFSDEAIIKKAAALLAEFHKRGVGIFSEFSVFGMDIKRLLQKRMRELKGIKRKISEKQKFQDSDIVILKYYDECVKRYRKSAEILDTVSIPDKKIYLCHNSYRAENIRISKNGCFFIEGLEGCELKGSPMSDLSELIRRYSKCDFFKTSVLYDIISEYSKIIPINENDLRIIEAMLIFPKKFMRLVNECYNKRRSFVSSATVKKMESAFLENDFSIKASKMLSEI